MLKNFKDYRRFGWSRWRAFVLAFFDLPGIRSM